MQTYTKQPQSIANQISMLKQRGLVFDDEGAAFQKLGVISYFRLANYWKPFESDKVNHIFKPNSKFENVLSLYNFDKELRCLLFSAIQSIEIALRTKVIQIVSSSYGSFWFADASLFSNPSIYSHCLSSLDDEIKRSKEEFLIEHFNKYNTPAYPPVWKTLEISSFGTLSKLYCNLTDTKIKKQIAKELGLPQHIYLESWIKSLSVLRNCIAHHARIWNKKYPWKPQLPKKLTYAWISDFSSQTKLYPQICCILYLLNVIKPENQFKENIKALLDKYSTVDYSAMGFPQGWENEPLWR